MVAPSFVARLLLLLLFSSSHHGSNDLTTAVATEVVPIQGIGFDAHAVPLIIAFERIGIGKELGIVGGQIDKIAVSFATEQGDNELILTSL